MTHTLHWYLILGQKHVVAMEIYWKYDKIQKNHVIFAIFSFFGYKSSKKCIFWWSEKSNILVIIVGYSRFISKMGLKILYV